MRTVYVEPGKAERILLGGRAILSRLPGILIVVAIVLAFYRDSVWPYHLLTGDWVSAGTRLMTDASYREWWMGRYALLASILFVLMLVLGAAFKLAVWNRVFKVLKVRSRDVYDKVETELGRAYWIEDWSGRGILHTGKWLLRTFRIVDLRVGKDPRKHYRTVRAEPRLELAIAREGGSTDFVAVVRPKTRRRTIFYKASLWPPINPISPHRSMHRLVVDVPDRALTIHDGTTIMVEGTNPKRDLSKDYPTFYLTSEETEYVPLDTKMYKEWLDDDIKKATYTTNIASQMDTFLLKDQRKFQEVSVPVNPEMAKLVKKVEP